MPIYVVYTVTRESEFSEEMQKIMQESVEATKKEEGCLNYTLVKDITVPGICQQRKNCVTIVQTWSSLEAFQNHVKQPHVQKLLQIRKAHPDIKTETRLYTTAN